VFPNPNSGTFTINVTGSSDAVKQIRINDMIGNTVLIKSFSDQETIFDLSTQPKGIYFLEVKNETGTFNKKIVIQ
jgi:hypothetical protein